MTDTENNLSILDSIDKLKREAHIKPSKRKKQSSRSYQSKQNKYRRDKAKSDPLFRLKRHTGKIISNHLRSMGLKKSKRTEEIIGISYDEFYKYLEGLFAPWMSWNNAGRYKKGKRQQGWDIDHIIPISTATTEEDIIRLNHYTNMQPLCSFINRHIKKNQLNFKP